MNKIIFEKQKTINDVKLLKHIKKTCYIGGDVRAGWVAGGLPHTDIPEYKNIAKWCIEHWLMYYCFIMDFMFDERKNTGNILDVGCGMGYASAEIADLFPNSQITAIDSSKKCIKFAKKYNNRKNCDYIKKDFLKFNSNRQYQYIFALEILEHIKAEYHYDLIDKCLDILTDNGLLFITTPNALDERDGKTGHIGLLNRERAKEFFQRYFHKISASSFYNNKVLLSFDYDKIIVKAPLYKYETIPNASHFRFILRKYMDI